MRDDDKTDLPGWLGLRSLPDFTKARWLGPLLTFGAVLVVGGLFLLALVTAFTLLSSAAFGSLLDDPRSALGVGGVTVALIGAPFVIWRSVVAQKTVTLQEQGHITDRINTAVEGLGAEKEVNRIGRPVTIWTGKPGIEIHQVEDAEKFTLPPRSIETRRYRDISPLGDPDGNEYHEGLHVKVKFWPEEKTIIEWLGTDTAAEETEHLGKVGGWQPFPETQPNLEVRIGAIYALERIAQDSDRDHVQIMEILCAYIRQNAPAPTEDDWPDPEMKESEEEGPLTADWPNRRKMIRLGLQQAGLGPKLRTDIHVALTVIGRRTPKQRRLEAGRGVEAEFPFDLPCPFHAGEKNTLDSSGLCGFSEKLNAWGHRLNNYEGYRIDLRHTDLRGADLTRLNLNGVRLAGAHLQWACLQATELKGANLFKAQLQKAVLSDAKLQGSMLFMANLQEVLLDNARLEGSNLTASNLEGAWVFNARLQSAVLPMAILHGAKFNVAHMQGTDLRGVHLDAETAFSSALLHGAAIKKIDCANTPPIVEHIKSIFGDASVTLPGGHGPDHKSWPAHWPKFDLGDGFEEEWRKWQADPDNYRPPDPPGPYDPA